MHGRHDITGGDSKSRQIKVDYRSVALERLDNTMLCAPPAELRHCLTHGLLADAELLRDLPKFIVGTLAMAFVHEPEDKIASSLGSLLRLATTALHS